MRKLRVKWDKHLLKVTQLVNSGARIGTQANNSTASTRAMLFLAYTDKVFSIVSGVYYMLVYYKSIHVAQ